MIVCHCHGLTDRDIRSAAERTAARDSLDLGLDCPAATCCGGCRPLVDQILAGETRRRAESRRSDRHQPRRSA